MQRTAQQVEREHFPSIYKKNKTINVQFKQEEET